MIEGTRVKSILSKFESNLEQLNLEDRNSSLVNLPKPSFQTFQRSATCIDFKKIRSQSESEKNKINDTKNQSNFDRPTSENSKRGSIIRRSPAFRLNHREKPAIPKPKDEKKPDPVITQQKIPADYAFLSDTLRKALKRPLPIGPPPKKPPRAFESPVKEFVPMPTLDSSEESISSSPETSHIVNKSNQFLDLKSRDAISHHTSQTIAEKENHYYDTVSHADDEPIYSQPVFRRLSGSLNNSCCSNSDAGDLHYMCTDCTNLSQTSSESEDHLIGVQNVNFLNINDFNSMKETTDKKNSSYSKQKMDKYEKVNFMLSVVYSDDTVKDCGGNTPSDEIDASQSDRESQCSNSNYNCKLARQVTERRKDYVRSISSSFKNIKQNSKYESLIPKYCTIASEKPEPIANKIKLFTQIIEQNKKREESLTVNRRQMCTEKLFESCYLIGYNQNMKEPYVKSVYPSTSKQISYIEQFVYPYTKKTPELTKKDQNFCIILTDENGRHIYGYCRQVMPESFEFFLPLTYCIVSTVRSTGFYYNVLKEIESRHGQTEQQMNYLLKCIHQNAIPKCGSQLEVKLMVRPVSTYIKETSAGDASNEQQRTKSPKSIWIMENNEKQGKFDEIVVKRPLEYRLECSELLDLYESTSIELLTNIFGTLLIERKVILLSKNVAKLSSCIFALETILYPFRWQHTIITIVPDHLLELAEAPFPILVGILNTTDHFDCTNVTNGIVVDLDKKILLKHCNDEKTLLPRTLRKRLEFSLKLVDGMDPEKILSNVLIAEAFLKFFVELFFNMDTANYEKQKFLATKSDSPVKCFLDWFLETSMFHEFLKEKKIYDENKLKNSDVKDKKEAPCPSDGYFDLYSASIMYRCAYMDENDGDAKSKENFHAMKKNFKHLNKKHKSLLKRLKEFVNSD